MDRSKAEVRDAVAERVSNQIAMQGLSESVRDRLRKFTHAPQKEFNRLVASEILRKRGSR